MDETGTTVRGRVGSLLITAWEAASNGSLGNGEAPVSSSYKIAPRP